MTKVASPSWHRFSLAPVRFRRRFGHIHIIRTYSVICLHFLALAINLASNLCVHSWPKHARNHCVFLIFRDIKGGHLEAPGWEQQRKQKTHWAKLAPDRSSRNSKNIYFLHVFHHFVALPGTCDYVRHHIVACTTSKNMPKTIAF